MPRLLVMYFKKVSCQNLKGTCRYEHARYTLLSTPVFKKVFTVRGYQRTHVQLKTLHRSYMAQAVWRLHEYSSMKKISFHTHMPIMHLYWEAGHHISFKKFSYWSSPRVLSLIRFFVLLAPGVTTQRLRLPYRYTVYLYSKMQISIIFRKLATK